MSNETADKQSEANKDHNSNGKRARNIPDLTPEYIAQQRALREERKRQKKAEQQEKNAGKPPKRGQAVQNEFSTEFIKRPMLRVPGADQTNATVRIMSYNVCNRITRILWHTFVTG